jgi:hypothetical protein
MKFFLLLSLTISSRGTSTQQADATPAKTRTPAARIHLGNFVLLRYLHYTSLVSQAMMPSAATERLNKAAHATQLIKVLLSGGVSSTL